MFWIDASSVETIERGFEDLVNVCSQQGGENFTRTWLPTNKDWILVMDNADDPGVDLSKFFPQGKHGTIIITSRSADCRKYATSESWWWRVDQMEHEDAITLLLRAALESQDDPDKRALAKPIVECLGNFALAIVQASALIRQGHCTLTGFCDAFRDQKAQLFEYGDIREDLEYQHSVFTTWEISVKKIEAMMHEHAKLALEFLELFSFMHFDDIRRETIDRALVAPRTIGSYFPSLLIARTGLPDQIAVEIDAALSLLFNLSLINTDENGRISIHPLVHEWSRSRMSEDQRQKRCLQTASMLALSMPFSNTSSEFKYRRKMFPHVEACVARGEDLFFKEGSELMDRLFMARRFVLIYEENSRYEEALRLCTRIHQGHESEGITVGEDASAVIDGDIAFCLTRLGRYAEAIPLREKTVETMRRIRGENSSERWEEAAHLAMIYALSGQHEKGLELGTEIYENSTRLFGEDSNNTIASLTILGICYEHLERFEESSTFFDEALKTCSRNFGDQHEATVIAMKNAATSYYNLKKYRKARKIQEYCVNQTLATLGERHALTFMAYQNLANYCCPMDRRLYWRGGALKYREAAYRYVRDTLGDKDLTTLSFLRDLIQCQLLAGNLRRAEELQHKLIIGVSSHFGKQHPATLEANERLSYILSCQSLRNKIYWFLPKKVLGQERPNIG